MSQRLHVARPPDKPLLIFDGDCDLCRHWIARWREITGERVDYQPSQNPLVTARFTEIPIARYQESVQLIEPDGRVYSGAHAVCRLLATASAKRWPQWCYETIPGMARAGEWSYRLVANHRGLFSWLTRFFWGHHRER